MMTDVQTPLPPEIEHTEAADLLGPAPAGPPPEPGARGRAFALYRGQVGGVLRWYAHRPVREKLFFAFLVVDALALLFIVGGFVLRFPGWVSVVLTIVTCAVLVGASLGLTELLARTMFGPIDAATHALSRATGNGRWDLARDFAERIFNMFKRPFDPNWQMPDLGGPEYRQPPPTEPCGSFIVSWELSKSPSQEAFAAMRRGASPAARCPSS